MRGEADIIESLNALGYEGKCAEEKFLTETLNAGPKSQAFREFITWIANEIHVLGNTDEKIATDADFNEFMLEMSGLLKELGCPYDEFIAGPLTSRLQTRESRLLLFDFLLTELMSIKMCIKSKPQDNSYIIPVFETSTARALVSIIKELNLAKPPDNIGPKMLFDKISNKLDEAIKKTNQKKLSQPLFKPPKEFTDAQWKKLDALRKELDQEYNLRRQMLLTRLDVTVQSFQWSDKMKGKEDKIANRYQMKKQEFDQLKIGDMDTNIPALLAAREDLAIIEKTSNANVRKNTGSKIQKHVMGRVPDRGGRAYEHAPPPPEMPSWQQNRVAGPQGGGGRGGGGRGGGRQQGGGGWNQGQQQRGGQNFGQRQDQQQNNQNQGFNQQYDKRQQYSNQGGYGGGGGSGSFGGGGGGFGGSGGGSGGFGGGGGGGFGGGGGGGSFGGGGGNRVQGGWSQRGAQGDNYRDGNQFSNRDGNRDGNQFSNRDGNSFGNRDGNQFGNRDGNQYNNNQANNYRSQYDGQAGDGNRGNRGRSNYNRGGGGNNGGFSSGGGDGASGYWR